jgi:hypothetical protein
MPVSEQVVRLDELGEAHVGPAGRSCSTGGAAARGASNWRVGGELLSGELDDARSRRHAEPTEGHPGRAGRRPPPTADHGHPYDTAAMSWAASLEVLLAAIKP